ncbi:hypothetical protein MSG28_013529 [Choristoneura fumiferana]|uniref:Uncharacterized protein n=1 Tax=Choristoneura fumiferana TaxID=7141 RepID=A0ACC0K7U6_CHOFU|nr:hypothetical protein MSG28_013529 [Choristoneura fumiferana]
MVSGCGAFNVVLHECSNVAHHHSHGGAACGHAHAHAPSPPRSRFGRKHNGLVNGDYSMKDLASEEAHVASRPDRNINLRAALIHVIGDLIQSCGVLFASVLIKFYPAAKVVDPICTFVFSILVLLTSARVVRDALAMLMQAVPKEFRYREFVQALSSLGGVRHVHSVHAWALSTHHIVVSAHVAIDELTDWEPVLQSCQQLAQQFGARAGTFQLERYSAATPACAACRQPGHVP